MEVNEVWEEIRKETRKRAEAEPVLASFFHTTVLEHDSFSSTLANHLANDLSNASIQPMMLRRV
ncbi:MAG TPA: serine O-acetyltransferase, partial [Gammaproteobacteria bacterium]|nr:serine O-acetyltransferase [Gammaproteobacteria bacterium]